MHKTALLLASALVSLATACAPEASSSATGTDVANETAAAPVRTIYAGASDYRTLAGDAEYVYWTESSTQTVKRAPRAGGDPTVLWQGHGMDSVGAIAVANGVVYFNEDGRILSVPAAGGSAKELARVQRDFPSYLAVDGDYVYWGGENENEADYLAYVRRVKTTGGRYETVYTGYYGISSLAVKDGTVYFAGSDATIIMNPPHRLMKVLGSGGQPMQLLETPGVIRSLAVDGEHAFVAIANQSWELDAVDVTGGASNTLVTLPLGETNEIDRLGVSSNEVFWASAGTFDFGKSDPDNHDAHVWSVPKTGGAPELVAEHIASPNSVSMAGEYPIWTAHVTIETPSRCH
jgi:sugar lactone lactonase YvrE